VTERQRDRHRQTHSSRVLPKTRQTVWCCPPGQARSTRAKIPLEASRAKESLDEARGGPDPCPSPCVPCLKMLLKGAQTESDVGGGNRDTQGRTGWLAGQETRAKAEKGVFRAMPLYRPNLLTSRPLYDTTAMEYGCPYIKEPLYAHCGCSTS
jgi:hypothetical protein